MADVNEVISNWYMPKIACCYNWGGLGQDSVFVVVKWYWTFKQTSKFNHFKYPNCLGSLK